MFHRIDTTIPPVVYWYVGQQAVAEPTPEDAREFRSIFGPIGVCHICKETRSVKLCDLCNHYLCIKCRFSPKRGYEFAKEIVFGRRDGCCGPME